MNFDINDANLVVDVAVDRCNGQVREFTNGQADDLITKALITANNGKTAIDFRDIRDGKCGKLFSMIELIIKKVVVEGLVGDEYFNQLVDLRVVPLGDKPEFKVEDANWFTVSKVADGAQNAVRRQHLTGSTTTTVPTYWNVIKIYEELSRVLSRQANMAEMIRDVAKSFKQNMLTDIYSIWANATTTQLGGATYNITGVYDESTMLTLIDHVEAKSGNMANLYGTRSALRKLTTGVVADSAREDMYNMGYYGKFNGTGMAITPQRHTVGTDTFVFSDSVINVLAGPTKPIKVVIEGNPLVNSGNLMDKADLSQEYIYAQRYGVGFVLSDGALGRYTIS